MRNGRVEEERLLRALYATHGRQLLAYVERMVGDRQPSWSAAWSRVANYQGSLDITGSTAIAAAGIRQLAVVTDAGKLPVALPGRQ